MKITKAEEAFRAVTITIETQKEWDELYAVVTAVAENRTQHTNTMMRAAIDLRILFNRVG